MLDWDRYGATVGNSRELDQVGGNVAEFNVPEPSPSPPPPPSSSVSVINTHTDRDTQHAISISNEKGEKGDRLCIPWDVFSKALEQGSADVRDEDGWRAWERLMIDRMEIVDANTKDS